MDDVELTKRLCEVLGEIDGWEWRPDGPNYTSSETGIFYGAIREKPDQAIGVRVYAGTDPLASYRSVQVRVRGQRGDPAGADRLASLAFKKLHERSDIRGVSFIHRTSFGPLGADENGREERSDNYRIILENEEA